MNATGGESSRASPGGERFSEQAYDSTGECARSYLGGNDACALGRDEKRRADGAVADLTGDGHRPEERREEGADQFPIRRFAADRRGC